MAVKHVNRKGQTFHLHETRTKTGKPKFFFSMKDEGVLVVSIPDGFEVYENPDAHVFLCTKLPEFITDHEIAVVREGLRRHAKGRRRTADVRERHVVVHHLEKSDRYQKVLRFTLIDEDNRGSPPSGGASWGRSTTGSACPAAADCPKWSRGTPRTSGRDLSSS